jgi:bacillithiol biosynthesis cysteine-adding enzyme BshC
MDCTAQFIGYEQTGTFSRLVTDYLGGKETLRPFYTHPVSLAGLRDAIREREAYPTNRVALVQALRKQYQGLPISGPVERNLGLLEKTTTFTITTAHQPNIFTGHLYFIYKILHTIRLAAYAKQEMPAYDFVPVYFMGSEDADLEELGHIYTGTEKLEWETGQTGAVGRMSPKGLDILIRRLEGEFGGLPFGSDMISLCKAAYLEHPNIQEATLYLVHALFAEYGLVVLIPDNEDLKRLFLPILRRELSEGFSHKAVSKTIPLLSEQYKVQAAGRDINLFYLKGNLRNRIVRVESNTGIGEARQDGGKTEPDGGRFAVVDTDLTFSEAEMQEELEAHPDRFSPNVILRGVFQEQILPGIAFIGGGGELAYWLELKEVFQAAGVPYPVLILRNSFLLVKEEWVQKARQLNMPLPLWFAPEQELANQLVRRESEHQLSLEKEMAEMNALYAHISRLASGIDITLQQHISALQTRAIKGLNTLEKKLLKAERSHFEAHQRQIRVIKNALFPGGSLQERVENFMPYYAAYGKELMERLYEYSKPLDQQFCILTLPD